MYIASMKFTGSIAATGDSRQEVIDQLKRYGIDRKDVRINKAK